MNSETDKLETASAAAAEQSVAPEDAKEKTEAPLLPEGLLEAEALAEAESLETMLVPEEIIEEENEAGVLDGRSESRGTPHESGREAETDEAPATSTVVEISSMDETAAAAEPVQAVVIEPADSFEVEAEPAFNMAVEGEADIPVVQDKEEEPEPERLTDRELNEMIEGLCLSKAEEFQMIGYEHVTGEEIWECINDRYKKKGLPPLHQVVNDILSLKPNQFMNYLTLSMYRRS
ncbi:post-transcriptional regulator [Paenibacillus chitinolyticus]|uniref:post-transcriptional regulator n=1 Tax=Paenibacillus chitinolyticus TaxID=79263 RepID=UPI002DBFA0C8|nr:post-transcriptional regulator [Paenibacillus chitinolyticus]